MLHKITKITFIEASNFLLIYFYRGKRVKLYLRFSNQLRTLLTIMSAFPLCGVKVYPAKYTKVFPVTNKFHLTFIFEENTYDSENSKAIG